jgi:hypothetical protein
MSVTVDAGFIATESPSGLQSIVEVAQQTVGVATAPGAPNNRIDLLVIDAGTGSASVITGTPGNPPSPPAITAGKRQVAQIVVAAGAIAITASNITDLRAVWGSAGGGHNVPWAIAAGSADAITASYTPPTPNPIPDGYILGFRAIAANATTAPSFAPDGLTAHGLVKKGGGALLAGDVPGALAECLIRYNAANTRWELLNPAVSLPTIANNQVLANTSGATATPVGSGVSALLDATIGNARGSILVRQAAGWGVIGPGSSGQVPVSNGTDIAMGTPSIGAGTINQAALKTTSGVVSSFGANLVLPGGPFGFYPQVATGDGGDLTAQIAVSGQGAFSTIYTSVIYVTNNGAGTTQPSARQQYVQASPPYDIGDGDVRGFIFVLLERISGSPIAVYSAAEPPWIYNGPTIVVPDRIDHMGRRFRRARSSGIALSEIENGHVSFEHYRASRIERREYEITQDVYHADMPLIPHPFASYDHKKHVVILLDPMHDVVDSLLTEQQEGENIHSLIYKRRLQFDNIPLVRAGPPGVMQVAIKF